MPFRTPAERSSDDVEYLRGPSFGLAEGEWIAYWAVFPHSLTGKITSDATNASVDPATGRVVATFDPGIATIAKVAYGIVDWNLLDRDGHPVAWDPKRARELVDGLPPETFRRLADVVSTGAPAPNIADPADGTPGEETQGNASGGS